MISLTNAILFLLLAPIIGGLVSGIDRKLTARMQGRVGPPIFQPFYDVGKLLEKEIDLLEAFLAKVTAVHFKYI